MKKWLVLMLLIAAVLPVQAEEELSRKEVKAIAEKYIEAVLVKDYEAWAALMYEPVEKEEFKWVFNGRVSKPLSGNSRPLSKYKTVRKIEIERVRKNTVHLECYTGGANPISSWLLLLPSGEIKYDQIFVPHPIMETYETCFRLKVLLKNEYKNETSRENRESAQEFIESQLQRYREKLIEVGVPLFGYDPSLAESKQLRSLDKIMDWLDDEGREWDNSEPKVFIPDEYEMDAE